MKKFTFLPDAIDSMMHMIINFGENKVYAVDLPKVSLYVQQKLKLSTSQMIDLVKAKITVGILEHLDVYSQTGKFEPEFNPENTIEDYHSRWKASIHRYRMINPEFDKQFVDDQSKVN